jgi:hypothetical protein
MRNHPSCHTSRYIRCPTPQSNNAGQHNSVAIQYIPGLFSLSSYGTRAGHLFSSPLWSSVPVAPASSPSGCISLIMCPTDSYTSPVQQYHQPLISPRPVECGMEIKVKVVMRGTHPCVGLSPFRRTRVSTRHSTRGSNSRTSLLSGPCHAQTLYDKHTPSMRESSYDTRRESDDVLSVARNPNTVLVAKSTPAWRSLSKPNRASTIGARSSSVWTNRKRVVKRKGAIFELTVPSAERNRKVSIAILCTLRCGMRNALTTCGTKVSVSRFESALLSSSAEGSVGD